MKKGRVSQPDPLPFLFSRQAHSPHPHLLYPQFKQVAHPSMITTAFVLHLWHMVALGGKAAPSPVTSMSSLRGASATRGSGNRSPAGLLTSEFFFESCA